MRIFWSWQADRSARVCKHFVREALDEVVMSLREQPEIDDSDRPVESDGAGEIIVDQDTQGEAGMVEISATILRKINECSIFVADLTTIGISETGRQMANPNVLIELGYAMKCLPASRLLLITNTAWRFSVEKLPFDIRHRRGPITYNLSRDADDAERARVRGQLAGQLKMALLPMIAEVRAQSAVEVSFRRTPSTIDPARWWKPREVLYTCATDPQGASERGIDAPVPQAPLVYFRIVPKRAGRIIKESELKSLALRMPLLMALGTNGRNGTHNQWGGISYADEAVDGGGRRILGATQIFRNGEIWAFDTQLAAMTLQDLKVTGGHTFLDDTQLEQWTLRGMTDIAAVSAEHVGVQFPADVEFGVTPAMGLKLTIGRHLSGPCQLPIVQCKAVLKSAAPDDVLDTAVALFEQFWDGFGQVRPAHHNGIPPRHLNAR